MNKRSAGIAVIALGITALSGQPALAATSTTVRTSASTDTISYTDENYDSNVTFTTTFCKLPKGSSLVETFRVQGDKQPIEEPYVSKFAKGIKGCKKVRTEFQSILMYYYGGGDSGSTVIYSAVVKKGRTTLASAKGKVLFVESDGTDEDNDGDSSGCTANDDSCGEEL